MANKPITFTSGSLVKIKVDGVVVAYAVSVGYQISKQIIKPPILGEYGIPSMATALYNPVRGQLRVYQLAPKAARDSRKAIANANKELRADSTATVTDNTSTPLLKIDDDNDSGLIGLNENLRNSFDPAKVILSSTFDLEIVRAYPSEDQTVVYNLMTLIKDCRFETRSVNVPLGNVVNKTLSFSGTLVVNFSPDDPTGTNSEKVLEDHYVTDLVEPE